MTKYIRIEMADGKWDIPAAIIINNRAEYYSNQENNYADKNRVYGEEVDFLENNDNEIIDWLENNMDWNEVKASANKVENITVNYADGLCNGKKEVIIK